jgi:hypothetical protein
MLTNIFKKDITVIRKTGAFINRRWVEGLADTFTIKASVHPISIEEMHLFPEGFRDRMAYVLYTNTELKTSKPNNKNPDVVVLNDDKYQVIRVEKWDNTPLSHYRLTVVKVDSDAI